MISFDVVGAPAPQGSKKGFVVQSKKTSRPMAVLTESSKGVKPWRALIAQTAQDYAPAQPISGPVAVTLLFRMPVPKSAPKTRRLWAVKRPDLDKLTRAVLDALKGVMWGDDSQVVRLAVSKNLAYDGPIGCRISVQAISEAVNPAEVHVQCVSKWDWQEPEEFEHDEDHHEVGGEG